MGLIFVLLFNQIITFDITLGQEAPTKWGLVTILVERNLFENTNSQIGLSPDYNELSPISIPQRIERYARDIQSNNPYTKTMILVTEPSENPQTIASALELLYLEGDQTDAENAKLEGIVLVGDIPLPVVDFEGNKLPSIYPYVDFEEKAFKFNFETNQFEQDQNVLDPNAEIYHGVIKPSKQGSEGLDELATYFDKNHLFHEDNPDFSEFDKKILHADLVAENQRIDGFAYQNYLNYLEHSDILEDAEYTKELAEKLKSQTDQAAGINEDLFAPPDALNQEEAEVLNQILEGEDQPEDPLPETDFEGVPDLESHNIINNYITFYSGLFDGYLGYLKDYIDNTGRYQSTYTNDQGNRASDFDSLITLIDVKDTFTTQYLKGINKVIEQKLDDIFEEEFSNPRFSQEIPIYTSASLTGTVEFSGGNEQGIFPVNFTNHSRKREFAVLDPLPPEEISGTAQHANGLQLSQIQEPLQCTIFRGSVRGEDSKLVMSNGTKNFNLNRTDGEYANCTKNSFQNPELCMPELSNKPVFDPNSFLLPPAELAKDGASDYRSCFNFTETQTQKSHIQNSIGLIGRDQVSDDRLDKIRLIPSDIVLAVNNNNIVTLADVAVALGLDPENHYEVSERLLGHPNRTTVEVNNPKPGVNKITLQITRTEVAGKKVPSVVFHKEPTNLVGINSVGTSPEIPIDNPKYISFLSSLNNRPTFIDYPNVFDVTSLEDLEFKLRQLEQTLNTLSRSDDFDDYLTEIVEYPLVELAGQDAINWRISDLDTKHQIVLTEALSSEKKFGSNSPKQGYEALYLHSSGDANSISFNINPDVPDQEEDIGRRSIAQEVREQNEQNQNNQQSDEENGENLFEWFGSTLMTWAEDEYKRISEFDGETQLALACGPHDWVNIPTSTSEDAQKYTNSLVIRSDEDIFEADPAKTLKVEIASIVDGEFEDEFKEKLRNQGDQEVSAFFLGFNTSRLVNTLDSKTRISIKNFRPDLLEIVSPQPVSLINGVATVDVRIKDQEGTATLQAETQNLNSNITSNTLSIDLVKRYLQVSTYELTPEESINTQIEETENYLVYNNQNQLVARIHLPFGRAEILDDRYQAVVSPASENLSTHLKIQNPQTSEITARFEYITDPNEINFTDQNLLNPDNLQDGVNINLIKDIETRTQNSNLIFTFEGTDIALVTQKGAIYLRPDYSLDLLAPSRFDLPLVINLRDPDSNKLAEFALMLDYSNISTTTGQTLEEEPSFFENLTPEVSENNDQDGDGIADIQEFNIGTDPLDSDTDNDGFDDNEELENGFHPLKEGELFTDVPKDSPFYEDIRTLYLNGIIKGFSDGTFKPTRNISREEFTKLNFGAICLNCTGFSTDQATKIFEEYNLSPFPDNDISLLSCVAYAKNEGIVSGFAAGEFAGFFKPRNDISRAEAYKIIIETIPGINPESLSLDGKPWYYNYIIAAQRHELLPIGGFETLNSIPTDQFIEFFDFQLENKGNFNQFLKSPITRAEFANIVVKALEIQNCNITDSDGDGLSDNAENFQYGTDPLDPDSDKDGLSDSEEVIQNSNPNNFDDGFNFGELTINIGNTSNIKGINIERESITTVENGAGVFLRSLVDNIPADGVTTVKVLAEIYTPDGEIDQSDNSSQVEFYATTGTESITFANTIVRAQNGIAETTITSTTKAGLANIEARILNQEIPIRIQELEVYPLEPTQIDLDLDSNVLKAGNESKTNLKISIQDQNGNLAYNSPTKINLTTTGPISLDKNSVFTSEGFASVQVSSTDGTGQATIKATIDETEFSSQTTLNVRDDIKLQVFTTAETYPSFQEVPFTVGAVVTDSNGSEINNYQGEITFSFSDQTLGSFLGSETVEIENGKAEIEFQPNKKAGEIIFNASIPGFTPGQKQITLLPNVPTEIVLTSEQDTLRSGDTTEVQAKLFDQFGNLVNYDNTSQINFEISPGTTRFGAVVNNLQTSENGVATTEVRAANSTGEIRLIARLNDINSNVLTLTTEQTFDASTLANTNPDVLYAAVLGSEAGNIFEQDYLGGSLLFNGRTQAVTTEIKSTKQFESVANISPTGGITTRFLNEVYSLNNQKISPVSRIYTPDETLLEVAAVFNENSTPATNLEINLRTDDFDIRNTDTHKSLLKNGNTVLRVHSSGGVEVLDNELNLIPNSEDKFSFNVEYQNLTIARLTYSFPSNLEVKETQENFTDITEPGFYIKKITSDPKFGLVSTFDGNSTANRKGKSLIDKTEERNIETHNIDYGFDGDNKFMLLFSARNSVGDSTKNNSPINFINLGDPTIKLPNPNQANAAGYSRDLGALVKTFKNPVIDIQKFNYNNDSLEDLLVVQDDGTVDLLTGQKGKLPFHYEGPLLRLKNGVQNIATLDANNDGQEDILIGTEDPCTVDGICLDLFLNQDSDFNRVELNLNLNNPVSDLVVDDMDLNGFKDIVLVDESGKVLIYYNDTIQGGNVTFRQEPQEVGFLGFRVDGNSNLASEVFVNHPGQPQVEEDDRLLLRINERVEEPPPFQGATSTARTVSTDKTFVRATAHSGITQIIKQATDLNGEALEPEDKVKYFVSLKNTSANTISNMQLLDTVPQNLDVDFSTLKCLTCSEENALKVQVGPGTQYPFLIDDITLEPNQELQFEYTATFNTKQQKFEYTISTTENLEDISVSEFPEIITSIKGNPTGRLQYYFALRFDQGSRQVIYQDQLSAPPEQAPEPEEITEDQAREIAQEQRSALNSDNDNDGIPNKHDRSEGDPSQKFFEATYGTRNAEINLNLDEIQAVQEIGGFLDGVESQIAKRLDQLLCSEGCIPNPVNVAFLAPGPVNLLGTPVGFDPGFAAFCITFDGRVSTGECFDSFFRFYVAPTLNVDMGIAVCVGPGRGVCYAAAVPLSDLVDAIADICNILSSSIEEGISKANNWIEDQNGTKVISINEENRKEALARIEGENATGGITSEYLEGYSIKAQYERNVRIPGFPSVITNWIDKQTNEVTKLVEGFDIHIIYPELFPDDLERLVTPSVDSDRTDINSIRDVLTYINSIPLVQLESNTVSFDVPALTAAEIGRLINDSQRWLVDTENELTRALNSWKCSENEAICLSVTNDLRRLTQQVEQNIAVLKQWQDFPTQIIKYRQAEQAYIYQIICYIDAIMNIMGGYLQNNINTINQWERRIQEIHDYVENWQLIIDVFLEYQTNCDDCRSDRFTLLELLLRLFAVIPDLPIVELPRIPDLVVDISHIQAGTTIHVPDVKFNPVPLDIPPLPRIQLPDLPELAIDANIEGDIPILPEPPNLPDLPALPSIPLFELPNLPPPPSVPEFPVSIEATSEILKKVFKILCLLKKGLVPIPETSLKTEIEALTARSLTPLLPLDLGLGIETPNFEIDIFDEIRLTTYLELEVESEYISAQTQRIADDWNEGLDATRLQQKVRSQIEATFDLAEDFVQEQSDALQDQIDEVTEDIDPNPEDEGGLLDVDLINMLHFDHLIEAGNLLDQDNQNIAEYNANIPDEIVLEAKETVITPDHHELFARSNYHIQNHQVPTELEDSYLAEAREVLLAYAKAQETFSNNPYANKQLASLDIPQVSNRKDSLDLNSDHLVENLENTSNLIAQNFNEGSASDSDPQIDKGLYIYNEELQLRELLVAYNDIPNNTPLASLDVDGDTDSDILYVMGDELYLKENFNNTPERLFSTEAPKKSTIREIAPSVPAVNNFRSTNDEHQSSTLTFDPVNADIFTYEVFISEQSNNQNASIVHIQEQPTDPEIVEAQRFNPPEGINFQLPQLTKGHLVLKSSGPESQITTKPRTILNQGESGQLNPGTNLHTLENTTIDLLFKDGQNTELVLEANTILPYESFNSNAIGLSVLSGTVEIYNPNSTEEKQTIPAIEGMLINFDDKVENGPQSSIFEYQNGFTLITPPRKSFTYKKLKNPNRPIVELDLENGNYYARIRAINNEGQAGPLSEEVILAPQICGDLNPPFINQSTKTYDAVLYQSLIINASNAFDSEGEITKYFVDTSPGNGQYNEDFTGDGEIEVGPFNTPETRNWLLVVEDQAGNKSEAEITINIVVPELELQSFEQGILTGRTKNPTTPNMPFILGRDRSGVIEQIGEYETNDEGQIIIDDLNLEQKLLVLDRAQNVIAEIHPTTGNIKMIDQSYSLEFVDGRLVIIAPDNEIVVTFILVPNVNSDTVIDDPDTEYTIETVQNFNGVHLRDLNPDDEYNLEFIPGDSIENPGSTELLRNNRTVGLINTFGSIFLNEDNLKVRVKQVQELNSPLLLEITVDNSPIIEIYIAANILDPVNVLNTFEEIEEQVTQNPIEVESPFVDISPADEEFNAINTLTELGIIQGFDGPNGPEFRPDREISRAEFSKVVLEILCIEPRVPEAFIEPNVFFDIEFEDPLPWYYSYTKESYLLGLINGYLKEVNEDGLTPFKPNQNISLAEVSKILLEALELLEEIDLTEEKAIDGSPWYVPFIDRAQREGIITAAEATTPDVKLTRGEFIQIALRVLQINNCYNVPLNEDGSIKQKVQVKDRQFQAIPETDDLDPGVYIAPKTCNTCPCEITIDNNADLTLGDIVFTAIMSEDGSEVYELSNEIEIK